MKKAPLLLVAILLMAGVGFRFFRPTVKAVTRQPVRLEVEVKTEIGGQPYQTYHVGDTLLIKAALKDNANRPLSGQKITMALNYENRFRKVGITDTNGEVILSFLLNSSAYQDTYDHVPGVAGANSFTSSCCVPGTTGSGGAVIKPYFLDLSVSFGGTESFDFRKAHYSVEIVSDGTARENGAYQMTVADPEPESSIRGLYKGWDWAHTDPNTDPAFKDVNGNPMSFDGTDIVYWNDFNNVITGLINQRVMVKRPDGTTTRKKFVLGISPLSASDGCPTNVSGVRNEINTTIAGQPFSLPDMRPGSDFETAFCDKLNAIAGRWQTEAGFRDVIAGVRVGGGFQGEWGNGPTRDAYSGGSGVCEGSEQYVADHYGKGTYENYKNTLWWPLATDIADCAEAAANNHTLPDGSKIYFILESQPWNPAIGWKFNSLRSAGPSTCNDPGAFLRDCTGTYTFVNPYHFGGLETQVEMWQDGSGGIPQSSDAFIAPGYWLALGAMKSGVELFDFHGGFWEAFRRIPGLDLFTQAHIGNSCDRTGDGFVAFRENEDGAKKENSVLGHYYGDYDFCLYAPKADGLVDFRPVGTNFLPGERRQESGSWVLTQARGQHYVMARDNIYYQSRKLVSDYAYLDIDEGITSRVGANGRWKIKVVYLDEGTDPFSIDYYSTNGSLRSLTLANAKVPNPSANKTNTHIFKEASWLINDLDTSNRFGVIDGKMISADLRISKMTEDDIFHSAQVFALDLANDYFDPEPNTCPEWVNNGLPNDNGDANGDGTVNNQDKDLWLSQFRTSLCVNSGCYSADFNHDRKVCLSDLEIWRRNR